MTLLYPGGRYFLVIDDVWETRSWETIKLAFVENNRASRVITTTRNHQVARKAGEVYEIQPLSNDNSRKLFFARIFGGERKSSDHQPDDDCDKILRKCGGIPLAIITMASLLVGKTMDEWSEVHRTIGFSNKENEQVENTEKILSFSYYDLPSHLRTCLLYLSMFPEDSLIGKSTLVWMWIAGGFVQVRQGVSSFEIWRGILQRACK
jgi:disease resistance protein RPM1